MIRGYCIGGGLGIAMCCDLRIATENSTFAVPAAKLGLGYGHSGVKRLMDVVGPSFTKEIFYTARQFSAEEAKTMGLINRVVPNAELESYVKKYAETIAGNAPLTIKALKTVVGELVKDESKRDVQLHAGRGQHLLPQQGLPRGPRRLHGEAQAGVQRAGNRCTALPAKADPVWPGSCLTDDDPAQRAAAQSAAVAREHRRLPGWRPKSSLRFLPVSTGLRSLPVTAADPVLHFAPNRPFVNSLGWNFYNVVRGRVNNAGFVNDQDYARDGPPLIAVDRRLVHRSADGALCRERCRAGSRQRSRTSSASTVSRPPARR